MCDGIIHFLDFYPIFNVPITNSFLYENHFQTQRMDRTGHRRHPDDRRDRHAVCDNRCMQRLMAGLVLRIHAVYFIRDRHADILHHA